MLPKILPFPGVVALSTQSADWIYEPACVEGLLSEATDVARQLGLEVTDGWLEVRETATTWKRDQKQVTLSITHTAQERLDCLAAALCGEPQLPAVRMSRELHDYLNPRRAA